MELETDRDRDRGSGRGMGTIYGSSPHRYSGIQASSFHKYFLSTLSAMCGTLFQVPGVQLLIG
jgi:hypothetical protein